MNSNPTSPMVSLLSLLVIGATVTAMPATSMATERRDGAAPASMLDLTGRSPSGLRELSSKEFVLDISVAQHIAVEAFPVDVETLAPYLEMHGRAEAGVRPLILPWSVRMESVN